MDNYQNRAITKLEHASLYNLSLVYVWLPFVVLFPLALVWPLVPELWFSFDWMTDINAWMRLNSEKMSFEAGMYDLHGPFSGIRHVMFVFVCGLVTLLVHVFLLIPMIVLTWRYGKPINAEQRKNYWLMPFGLVLLWYLALYYQFDDGIERGSHLGQSLFGSWLVFPLTAGLWYLASSTIFALVVTLVKVFRHRKF